jgi:hypothetical protein
MQFADIIRYGLWCGIVTVSTGNQRAYKMITTWLPHLTANTITLLLPDIYRLSDTLYKRYEREASAKTQPQVYPHPSRSLLGVTLDVMIRDNPRYVLYVAPLAAGYLLSSPWFNIYKGKLAEKRLAGFGLDAIPHVTTAFALTRLVCDTADTAADLARSTGALAAWVDWCAQHHGLCSAVVLSLVTLGWEYSEYSIHVHELAQRGAVENINMQWSVEDTIADCLSNAVGWLLAIAQEHGLRIPMRS